MQVLTGKLYNWASDIDENTVQQALRSSRLDVVTGVRLMADAHVGIGATVGSVIATENAVIPAAVGVDIGCGICAVLTDLTAPMLPDTLDPFLRRVESAVPSGIGPRGGHGNRISHHAEEWRSKHRPRTSLSSQQERMVLEQFGTLGSGNHFFEVALDELNRVWVLLHSGSRGIGNRLATQHIDVIKRKFKADLNDLMREEHRLRAQHGAGPTGEDPTARLQEIAERKRTLQLEDPDLAYLIQGTPEFDHYISDMLWAQDYALANRDEMMTNGLREFFSWLGQGSEVGRIRCHHNFCILEMHAGRNLWITRKGAIRAQAGEWGVIPGSMGTRSYVVQGRGNSLSYNSAPHGAGRRMSRGQAKKAISVEELTEQMRGRAWNADRAQALLDEAPAAYKDIDQIIEDSDSLVAVAHVLTAVMNYKGT